MESDSGWLNVSGRQAAGGEVQWLASKEKQRTTVVYFRLKTTPLDNRQRTTVVGFKWRTLVVSGLLQVDNHSRWLQMKNGGSFPRRRRVVSFRWRTTALGKQQWLASNRERQWLAVMLQGNNYSGWLQMENTVKPDYSGHSIRRPPLHKSNVCVNQ